MSISVLITAGSTTQNSYASAQGSLVHVITNAERNSFGIGSDSQLKNAVGAVMGKNPNDAYLHSPTPWGDLFVTYNWQQTETLLRPVSSQILAITSEPTILATKKFTNNSSVAGTFNAGISEEVSNTTVSSWSNSSTVSFEQKITYGISFLGTGGGGETTLGFEQTFGKGGSESTTITVGSTSGVSVVLQPGESVTSKLTATRGTMKVRITYEASLRGNAALNYNPTYNGHHFWRQPIAPVVRAAGSSNSVKINEDLTIGYYTGGEIILENTKGETRSHDVEPIPGIPLLN